jgi:hypothetical protein
MQFSLLQDRFADRFYLYTNKTLPLAALFLSETHIKIQKIRTRTQYIIHIGHFHENAEMSSINDSFYKAFLY